MSSARGAAAPLAMSTAVSDYSLPPAFFRNASTSAQSCCHCSRSSGGSFAGATGPIVHGWRLECALWNPVFRQACRAKLWKEPEVRSAMALKPVLIELSIRAGCFLAIGCKTLQTLDE